MPSLERPKVAFRRLTTRPVVAGMMLALGVASLVLLFMFGSDPSEVTPEATHVYSWAWAPLALSFAATIVGAAALSGWNDRRKIRMPSRRAKIDKLSESLKEALDVIDTIRVEVSEGDRLLTELEGRRDTAERLAKLTEEEAAAVREALREEFQREGRRGLLRDAAFMVFGAGLGVLLSKAFS